MNKQVPQAPPPPPPFRGIRHYHNQSYKEEVHQASPPPPPPPAPVRRIKHYRKKSRDKMAKEEVHRAPPPPPAPPPPSFGPPPPSFSGIIQCDNQKNKEMDIEEVPRIPHLESLISQILVFSKKENLAGRSRCRLSHPSHPHPLTQRFGTNTRDACFLCGLLNKPSWTRGCDYHFLCEICNVEFHHGCHMFPRKATHPYHLQHPLTLTELNYEPGMISNSNHGESSSSTVSSTSEANTSDPNYKSGSVKISGFQFDIKVDKCTWCGKNIEDNWFYRCSICNFCLDFSCFQHVPPLLVANPKSHHHSLVLYPRPLLTPCDACGLVNTVEPSYACFQCYYMVHLSCIDLPRVIQITRHQHRLLYTPFLRSTISPCRICYKTIDVKYGQYSCNYEDCSYVAHSKCATHEAVWDKKELEWEPEEPDETEDIAPFKKVGNDMIKHFSHKHLLKLEKFDGVRDAEKQCEACILPINSRDFYNCIECDYFLHEVCAGLLLKLNHALHIHPLHLFPDHRGQFKNGACSVCSRKSTGFKYRCSIHCESLEYNQINICCILVPDYFNHKALEHPLFISTSGGENKIICKGCKQICQQSYLQCTICNFAMCYKCCTIPDEIYYRYDKHPLFLCYGEGVNESKYWCEVCEKEIDSTGWFYTCNECCVTIHRQCLFGSSSYMKPGVEIYFYSDSVEIVDNRNNTRPLCVECGQRCPSSVYYKTCMSSLTFCSLECVLRHAQKQESRVRISY